MGIGYNHAMVAMRKALWILVGLAVLGAVAWLALTPGYKPAATDKDGLMAVTDDAFGGPFTLTDQNGHTVTDQDLTGRYRLIYFGFTFCPAICPTELSKMTAALNKLGPVANAIQPVFITVDPERDTPEKMKNYIGMFHPKLIGLTGTPEQIKTVTKAYKIYAAKVQDPQMSEYTMDHTSWILFIGPDDRLLHIFKSEDSADDIARIALQWLPPGH